MRRDINIKKYISATFYLDAKMLPSNLPCISTKKGGKRQSVENVSPNRRVRSGNAVGLRLGSHSDQPLTEYFQSSLTQPACCLFFFKIKHVD